MSDKTTLGLGIIGISLILGLIADALLRTTPWGVNLPLWIGALGLAIALLARWQHRSLLGGGLWTILPAIFFAGAFAWRDSVTLGILNLLGLLTALALIALRFRSGQIVCRSMLDFATGALVVGGSAALGAFALIFSAIRWKETPLKEWNGPTLAIARGLSITIPLVLLFGSLFVAADAAFDGLVGRLFRFDFFDLINHPLVIVMIAWCVGGYLWLMLIGHQRFDRLTMPSPALPTLGIVEVSILLGALNVLFLAFVLVQFRYFFGGAELIEASTTLTYAEYARRGFFELVAVAALVLPLLLTVDWLARKDNPVHLRVFRLLVVMLVALLFVIIVSAVQRMRLYQTEFGMTELRLYTTAFMAWITIVFLWFLATVWRGKRERFAFGMVATGFLAILLLNWINPDELIVRTNVGRANVERPLDARYVATLSADAVPALLDALPSIPDKDARAVAEAIRERWATPSNLDWRSWNWGRTQAHAMTSANDQTLVELISRK